MRKYGRTAVIASAILFSSHIISMSCAAEDSVCFVLREYCGKIALFEEDLPQEPLAVYETPITSLYPADMELLREGIRLKSRAEVSRLIEDLGVE